MKLARFGCLVAACLLAACQEEPISPFGPGGLPQPTLPQGVSAQSTTAQPPADQPPSTPSPNDVEIIGLNRAGVSHVESCLVVWLFVPAENADYVNVWTPGVNDRLVATGPVNEPFSFSLRAGTYQLTLAVEKRKGDGTVYQDDRHHFNVTLVECGAPPPPRDPEPDPDPEPEPEPDPTCETDPTLCPPPPPEEPPVEHGACFYEVSGREKQATCQAQLGPDGQPGVFSTHDGSDHCEFVFPGVAVNGFNLAPGLSDEDCLRKQDQ